MRYKILLPMAVMALFLSGCSGVSQKEMDTVQAQVATYEGSIEELKADIAALEGEIEALRLEAEEYGLTLDK